MPAAAQLELLPILGKETNPQLFQTLLVCFPYYVQWKALPATPSPGLPGAVSLLFTSALEG
jgi:hypothetical protein